MDDNVREQQNLLASGTSIDSPEQLLIDDVLIRRQLSQYFLFNKFEILWSTFIELIKFQHSFNEN